MREVRLNLFPGGKNSALVLSYDDGDGADVRLAETFGKNGLKGTFHLNSGFLNTAGRLTDADVRKIFEAGHEISVHTVTHPHLTDIPEAEAVEQVWRDKAALEKITKTPVRGMSYPFGSYNGAVLGILRQLGMEYSRTIQLQENYVPPEDFLAWKSNCHHNDNILTKFKEYLARSRWDKPKLGFFHAWGHSYEFNRDDNWQVIEEFCAFAGGLENVWSATSIEMVDYVNAVRRLKFTTDNAAVYNPSAVDVWASVDANALSEENGAAVRFAAGEVTEI